MLGQKTILNEVMIPIGTTRLSGELIISAGAKGIAVYAKRKT